MNKLPLARSRDIVLQELGKELLLYDLKTHKAFSLNETSAAVFNACDGRTSLGELKNQSSFTDEIIFLALDELKKENLIEDGKTYNSPFTGLSRREVIRRVGFASMIALPVISSLVAPTAMMAQSEVLEIVCTMPGGALCRDASDCVGVFYCEDFGCLCIENCCTGESVPELELRRMEQFSQQPQQNVDAIE